MAKYENIEKMFTSVKAETAIFETGGHIISGHGDEVNKVIQNFTEKTE